MLWVCNTILRSFQGFRGEAMFCLEFPGEERNLEIPGGFKNVLNPPVCFFYGISHYILQYNSRYMNSSPGSISQKNLDGQILSTSAIMNMWWFDGQNQCTLCGANQRLPQSCPIWLCSFHELDKLTTPWEYQEQVSAHHYPQFVLTSCYQSSLLLGSIFPIWINLAKTK